MDSNILLTEHTHTIRYTYFRIARAVLTSELYLVSLRFCVFAGWQMCGFDLHFLVFENLLTGAGSR